MGLPLAGTRAALVQRFVHHAHPAFAETPMDLEPFVAKAPSLSPDAASSARAGCDSKARTCASGCRNARNSLDRARRGCAGSAPERRARHLRALRTRATPQVRPAFRARSA